MKIILEKLKEKPNIGFAATAVINGAIHVAIGASPSEAIGKLIYNDPKVFNIELENNAFADVKTA